MAKGKKGEENQIPQKQEETLLLGVDIGSTTAKIAIVDPISKELLFGKYLRHNADQTGSVLGLLREAHAYYTHRNFRLTFCGSGGITLAESLGAFFIQEVMANAIAVRAFFPQVRTAIELGGQDAKVIFFNRDPGTGTLSATDMRMNGTCAGGTGAFIDQIAELLSIPVEGFNALADRGNFLYDISGRCGVFAKTDIQPLLNQGAAKEDIALSAFHAIAKQTIGGLAQGMEITPPVIFEGGPLTFNPVLVRAFKERLSLGENKVIIPEKPELLVAHGAALSSVTFFSDKECGYSGLKTLDAFEKTRKEQSHITPGGRKKYFFSSSKEREAFFRRHPEDNHGHHLVTQPGRIRGFLGIDAGSTTTKFVLLSEEEELLYSFYSNNDGAPLRVIQSGLIDMYKHFQEKNTVLSILGLGTTGYGEKLFASALRADYHTVETVAHAEAARKYLPQVSFILDIGGQDMKAIYIKDGIVTNIVLNEACSAGCGSFIETYARSLGIPVENIAEMAFAAAQPSRLGSRCTVFMNSSIITEQKNGKTSSDILAGLCRSIIENVFTKVVRIANTDTLGEHIVVQGGTFRNNAVLRAFEQYIGKEAFRPPYPAQMGAIGIALLTKKNMSQGTSSQCIGKDSLENFDYTQTSNLPCTGCNNNCSRTVVTFATGDVFITGNRCERGAILENNKDNGISPAGVKDISREKLGSAKVPDMVEWTNRNIGKDHAIPANGTKRPGLETKTVIGLPRVLEFYSSLPFWRTLFTALGHPVVVSGKSTYTLFERGLKNIPSDTICFPAKLVHGHLLDLVDQGAKIIFFPMMVRVPKENKSATDSHVCSVVQGYPLVAAQNDETEERYGVSLEHPVFHWYNQGLKKKQVINYLEKTFSVSKGEALRAFTSAEKAFSAYQNTLVRLGTRALEELKESGKFGIVLAGRPYHVDPLINHNVSKYFTAAGIPVLTLDSLPGIHKADLAATRMETTIPFHTRMIEAALYVAKCPELELVQIVSFGCGHDAVLSDEITRILRSQSGKEPLVLKLDEGESKGPLNIRITSFIETVKERRKRRGNSPVLLPEKKYHPFGTRFLSPHKKEKIILTPNLSYSFSKIATSVLQREGYKTVQMPLADEMAIELGKKYVHNDICFPAQINIGEALSVLKRGCFSPSQVALALAKNCEDCRAGQYAMLARKALDDAGYPEVPIITTGRDTKNIHPGARLGVRFQLQMVWGIVITDALETMRRAIEPYELIRGSTQELFKRCVKEIARVLPLSKRRALQLFEEGVRSFNSLPLNPDREVKPRVGIVGEILLNYHPGSNHHIEEYLVKHGMEVVIPPMLGFFRRSYVIEKEKGKRALIPKPFLSQIIAGLTDSVLGLIEKKVSDILAGFRHQYIYSGMERLVENVRNYIDVSYQAGEGWLMPAEIIEMIHYGVESFIIVQPFGCLPNHITGRGMMKSIKKQYPQVQILSLDYDPDTSLGNIENRLQMLILSSREKHLKKKNDYMDQRESIRG
jgi:predicted CoA-substrate-specific enzyme activase